MPLLGVGWTLNFEMYFYAVFTLALAINRRVAPLIAWLIVYAVISANAHADNWLLRFYSHGYIHYFLYGIALFYVWSLARDHHSKMADRRRLCRDRCYLLRFAICDTFAASGKPLILHL